MAWRSDSESNEELAEKLEANDLISSPHIIAAFRASGFCKRDRNNRRGA
eukprot:COSAG04_NODE_8711_length_940_cov_1.103448_1_plen_49_part_00